MKYSLYQMNIKSELKFMEIDMDNLSLSEHGYKKVYEGNIKCSNSDINDILDVIFEKFNIDHPNDFKGHSLSVSDLVFLNDKAYYCQSFGWKEVKIID